MSMDVNGMQELMNRLKTMGTIGERIEEKALKAGAEILQREMERRAPRSTFNKRHLAESIILSEVVKGNIDVGPHKDFFYTRFLEYGTVNMDAQPFIEPAFLAVRNRIKQVMADVIRRELSL